MFPGSDRPARIRYEIGANPYGSDRKRTISNLTTRVLGESDLDSAGGVEIPIVIPFADECMNARHPVREVREEVLCHCVASAVIEIVTNHIHSSTVYREGEVRIRTTE